MIKQLKQKVIKYLKIKPLTKDNDMLLQALIWISEYRAMGYKDDSLGNFLNYYAKKKFTNPSSIKRCRAKLQELHIELRGELYEKRHQKSVAIRDEIKRFIK